MEGRNAEVKSNRTWLPSYRRIEIGAPCYRFESKNIVLIHKFKNYCAYLFFKGVLLRDKKGILIQQTKNVQAARQIRFTGVEQITKMQATLKEYIYECIAVEEAGLNVELKKINEYETAEEFQTQLDKSTTLKKACYQLTPGRQRTYLLYFSSAKQLKTRESRVLKHMQRILAGKG